MNRRRVLPLLGLSVLVLAGCSTSGGDGEPLRSGGVVETDSSGSSTFSALYDHCYELTLGRHPSPDMATAIAWNEAYRDDHGIGDVHACFEGVRSGCYWSDPCRPAREGD